MSWPYVAAAWRVPLTPTQKLTLLALSDQADGKGQVLASNAELRRLTGLSEQSIRRSVRQLVARTLVREVNRGFASDRSRFALLHLHGGATVVGGAKVVGGANGQGGEVPNRILSSDPLLIPKSRKAEAPRRLEIPTRDQVTKLVHILIEDDAVEIGDDGDLRELVKRACGRADFVYDRAVVDDGIMRALAARGHNPNYPLDMKRLRQSRRGR